MSLTSTSWLKDLGGGGTTYHPTGLRRGCPGAGGRCLWRTVGGLLKDGDKERLMSTSVWDF